MTHTHNKHAIHDDTTRTHATFRVCVYRRAHDTHAHDARVRDVINMTTNEHATNEHATIEHTTRNYNITCCDVVMCCVCDEFVHARDAHVVIDSRDNKHEIFCATCHDVIVERYNDEIDEATHARIDAQRAYDDASARAHAIESHARTNLDDACAHDLTMRNLRTRFIRDTITFNYK